MKQVVVIYYSKLVVVISSINPSKSPPLKSVVVHHPVCWVYGQVRLVKYYPHTSALAHTLNTHFRRHSVLWGYIYRETTAGKI